jgi:hypothetical protein
MMALPAAFLSWRWLTAYRATPNPRLYLLRARWAFGDIPGAVEYGIYFCLYLWLVGYAGFAISTLLFGQLCLHRSGLGGARWIAVNVFFTTLLVIILRVLLGLWFPMAPIFKLLPAQLGNVLSSYL